MIEMEHGEESGAAADLPASFNIHRQRSGFIPDYS
jgi:hypothetical protein